MAKFPEGIIPTEKRTTDTFMNSRWETGTAGFTGIRLAVTKQGNFASFCQKSSVLKNQMAKFQFYKFRVFEMNSLGPDSRIRT